jgi:hypothetical protein
VVVDILIDDRLSIVVSKGFRDYLVMDGGVAARMMEVCGIGV